MKILIVDDDPIFCGLLGRFLAGRGYEAVTAAGGEEALRLLPEQAPDAVILDVMMPGMDGWETMRQLRAAAATVPVIFLTALGEQADVLAGLGLGADDYIKKPFDFEELALRLAAVLRRARLGAAAPAAYSDSYLRIDPERQTAFADGQPVHLTPTEYRLLSYLAARPGRPVSHRELLREVWGPGYEDDLPNLQVYVRYLREKLEPDPRQPRYLHTVRGVGYRFGG